MASQMASQTERLALDHPAPPPSFERPCLRFCASPAASSTRDAFRPRLLTLSSLTPPLVLTLLALALPSRECVVHAEHLAGRTLAEPAQQGAGPPDDHQCWRQRLSDARASRRTGLVVGVLGRGLALCSPPSVWLVLRHAQQFLLRMATPVLLSSPSWWWAPKCLLVALLLSLLAAFRADLRREGVVGTHQCVLAGGAEATAHPRQVSDALPLPSHPAPFRGSWAAAGQAHSLQDHYWDHGWAPDRVHFHFALLSR